jgi:tRNA pseudouridine55 synthase
VRSLAADLGTALGGGAHLRALRRVGVGPWGIDDAVPLDRLGPDDVRPPLAAVRHLAPVTVAGDLLVAVGHGRVLPRAALGLDGTGPWAVLGPGGSLLAVYEGRGVDEAKPVTVLAPGS